MSNLSNQNREYISFFAEVKERIRRSQYVALKSVNKKFIQLYWDIGQMIVDKQQRLGWGKSVVEQLSKDIQKEYPGIKGFSIRNLWNMKRFYSELQQNEKLQPLVAEISWTKNILILRWNIRLKQQRNRLAWQHIAPHLPYRKNTVNIYQPQKSSMPLS